MAMKYRGKEINKPIIDVDCDGLGLIILWPTKNQQKGDQQKTLHRMVQVFHNRFSILSGS
jgi:hypothetical protein